ncbi:MAG: DNA repair protein RecO, partial [Sphaerochaetaceae bacterium]
LVTLLSPTLGIISAVNYGGRKGKLASAVKPFTNGKYYLYYNNIRKEYSIRDAQISSYGDFISCDILNLYVALPMVELAMRVEGGDWAKLYALLKEHLNLFETQKDSAKRIFIQYGWRMIELMGLQCDLSQCPICLKNYQDDETLYFNYNMHTVCCLSCSDGQPKIYEGMLPPGARRYLSFTEKLSIQEAVKIELSATASERLFRYVVSYLTTILGSPLKSLNKSVLETKGF